MKWRKREIEQAIRILEVASCASHRRQVEDFREVAMALGFDSYCASLAFQVEARAADELDHRIGLSEYTMREQHAEAAQLLREGWLP